LAQRVLLRVAIAAGVIATVEVQPRAARK
jgi:hypothetical protein